MKRIQRFLFILLLALLVVGFWTYRQLRVAEAAEFLPVAPTLPLVPSGTEIRAVLSDQITEMTRPGDEIIAFIAVPVTVRGVPLLPSGIQLNGTVEEIERQSGKATVRLRFHDVLFNDKTSPMETQSVVTTTRVTTDMNILADAMDTITGAGVGVALGTASQDPRAVEVGLARGSFSGIPVPTVRSPVVTLVLTGPLRVRT